MVNDIRTQSRAICPACFAQQAIKNGTMVNHGYRRPQHWHSNVGTCNGAGQMHYGTTEGRNYTAAMAENLRVMAGRLDTRSESVLAGTEVVLMRKRVAVGVSQEVVVENPTQLQRSTYAEQLKMTARMMRRDAVELDAKVAEWVAVAPVEVAVAAKTETLVHGYSERMRGKLCAASFMGAQKGLYSRDTTQVTCEKCKARLAK